MEFWKEFDSIKELINIVNNAKVDFTWEKDDGCRIIINAAGQKKTDNEVIPASENPVTVKEQTDKMPQVKEDVRIVTSPLVGTFYSAASPEDEPFVKVGDKVTKGQKLGIIEAMKLMNDIESDFDGEIVEIMVSNEDMVEYGQPLFKLR